MPKPRTATPKKGRKRRTKALRPPGSGKRGPIKGQGGRPRWMPNVVEVERIERMSEVGATHAEMAALLDVDEDTFRNRVHDTSSVSDAIKRGNGNLKVSLRRKQVKIALNDRHPAQPTMLVWCGKVLLGQSERLRIRIETEDDAVRALHELFPDIPLEDLKSLDTRPTSNMN